MFAAVEMVCTLGQLAACSGLWRSLTFRVCYLPCSLKVKTDLCHAGGGGGGAQSVEQDEGKPGALLHRSRSRAPG